MKFYCFIIYLSHIYIIYVFLFYNIHLPIYIYILYSNQIYRRKKWAIYTRNSELTERIKKEGIDSVYNQRICGSHFADNQYNTIERFIIYI